MLQIPCPWCGVRDETEFCCGGESHIVRPLDPARVSDVEWADYQFNRGNPKGVHRERWRHTHGCRQWFNMVRDTANHAIVSVYKMGESCQLNKPAIGGDQATDDQAGREEIQEIEEARLSASH